MTAQELRIGNWVSWYNDKDDQFQMDSVTKTNGRLVNPIPLTQEWLLKFGFEEYDDNVYLLDPGKDFLYSFFYRLDVKEINLFPPEVDESIDTIIEYVHQLQNLYFALTGSELTIKE